MTTVDVYLKYEGVFASFEQTRPSKFCCLYRGVSPRFKKYVELFNCEGQTLLFASQEKSGVMLLTDKSINIYNNYNKTVSTYYWNEIDKIIIDNFLIFQKKESGFLKGVGSARVELVTSDYSWNMLFEEFIKASHSLSTANSSNAAKAKKEFNCDYYDRHQSKSNSSKTSTKKNRTRDNSTNKREMGNEKFASKNADANNSPQEIVFAKYNELTNCLTDTLNDLYAIESNNSDITKIRRELTSLLEEKISEIKNEAKLSLGAISWDHLVIAFFGETNAGKSTIIETFRILFEKNRKKNSDGEIVGDGQLDFTKDYNEYPLEIKGRKFTLIDVPGIEGNEKEYKEGIKKALRKAHCVFYVQGHNKKPDEATAKKIKEYLGDWVKVYSIQNVRGPVSDYDEDEERQTLLTAKVVKNEQLIKQSFERILGKDVYGGNVPLQALLAMCSKAQFSEKREDLQNNQSKLLRYFGSADEVLRFSQFQTIVNLVEDKSSNFLDEIAESNKQKMISLANKSYREIESILANQESKNKEIRSELNSYKQSIITITGNASNALQSRIPQIVRAEFSKLKEQMFSALDDDNKSKEDKKRKVQQVANNLAYSLPAVINNSISSELKNVKNKIDYQRKKLDGVTSFKLESYFDIDIDFDINVNDALDELDINLEDVADFAGSVIGLAGTGALIGSFAGPVGTFVGAGIGGFVGFIKGCATSNDGIGDAKNQISSSLKNKEEEVLRKVNRVISPIKSKLSQIKNQGTRSADNLLTDLNEIDESIEDVKDDLQIYINIIKSKRYGRV